MPLKLARERLNPQNHQKKPQNPTLQKLKALNLHKILQDKSKNRKREKNNQKYNPNPKTPNKSTKSYITTRESPRSEIIHTCKSIT